MHWYFQLSSLVFIPSPALPSSLFMPHNRHLGLQLRVSGSVCPWTKSFISYMGKKCWELRRVFMRLSGKRWASGPRDAGELLWILGEFSMEVLWSSCGSPPDFTWRSCKFPVEVLWNACASPQLSQAVVASSPGLYINFYGFSRVRCKPSANPGESADGFGVLRLEQHWLTLLIISSEEGFCALAFFFYKVTVPPGPCLDQSSSYCLGFVFVFFFPPYLMNWQLFMQIRVEETFKGYL